jgi:hypothetical protein
VVEEKSPSLVAVARVTIRVATQNPRPTLYDKQAREPDVEYLETWRED